MLIVTHMHVFVNTPHSLFAVGKTMETFRSDMSTYVISCTLTRPRKSKWCSRRGQSFFVDGVYIPWWLCTRIY